MLTVEPLQYMERVIALVVESVKRTSPDTPPEEIDRLVDILRIVGIVAVSEHLTDSVLLAPPPDGG